MNTKRKITTKQPATRIRKKGPVDPRPKKPKATPKGVKLGSRPSPARQAKTERSEAPLTPLQKGQLAREQLQAAMREHEKADENEAAKRGRPSMFTPTLGLRICSLIRGMEPYHLIWQMEGLPDEATFFRWLAKDGEEFELFRESVVRAREDRASNRLHRIELLQRRLTDPSPEVGMPLDAQQVRAAIEAERILMECEAPRKYGKSITIKGDPKNPIQVNRTPKDLTDAELMALARGGLEGAEDDAQ
jgi:hypothetical protein